MTITATVETTSGVLEYTESGDPDGVPVVLVHGFPDDPSTWDTVVRGLPDDLRCIRPALRGVAGSRTDPGSWSGEVAALATDLLDLLDALDLDRVLLVGHDWGARAAHAVAATAPERLRGLVTIARPRTAPGTASPRRRPSTTLRWRGTAGGSAPTRGAAAFRRAPHDLVTWAWDHWSPPSAFDDDARRRLLASFASDEYVDTVVHYCRHGAGAADGNPRYAATQAFLDTWPTIRVPTTFLVGDADGCETLPAARVAARSFAADLRLVELADVGHWVQREAPDAVVEAVLGRL